MALTIEVLEGCCDGKITIIQLVQRTKSGAVDMQGVRKLLPVQDGSCKGWAIDSKSGGDPWFGDELNYTEGDAAFNKSSAYMAETPGISPYAVSTFSAITCAVCVLGERDPEKHGYQGTVPGCLSWSVSSDGQGNKNGPSVKLTGEPTVTCGKPKCMDEAVAAWNDFHDTEKHTLKKYGISLD
jgi:hypothetical protein